MSNATDTLPASAQFVHDHPVPTMGPWLIGGVGDFFLTGAIVVMGTHYWAQYRKTDALFNRILVAVAVVGNLLKSAQTFAILWDKAELLCLLAQLFFVVRLWKLLGGLRWLLVPLVPALLMGLAGNIALTIQIYRPPTPGAVGGFEKTSYVALVGGVVADLIVTIATTSFLIKSKTGCSRTDGLILRLLRLTWLTAVPPTICAILNIVTYATLASRDSSLFITFNLLTPKLYTIAMLFTLNSRVSMMNGTPSVEMLQAKGGVTVTTSTFRFTEGRKSSVTSSNLPAAAYTGSGQYKEVLEV
ncbi:hypothetical protein EXIGLDRAFT_840471 [Exidia glandulosa HHB12029]|uniref:DUF6534 domain-containing protein n=1 Tax=Exidia glandulosa HHB12029 TaxID=1314781 RepID=A0A165EF02_EXIGL|nr:hypothetical protein EXIGLDRAFT_840471 [Exidia glandulosa HHB12029]